MQQQKPQHSTEDHLGELDSLTKSLDEGMIEMLNSDVEYLQINAYIQEAIQVELMRDIKARMNNNPDVVAKVKRLKEIINDVKSERENEDRKSMSELNDYIKNYSDMTFNEYMKYLNRKLSRLVVFVFCIVAWKWVLVKVPTFFVYIEAFCY